MSLSIYHYVGILMVFLFSRLLFRWIIALYFQLRFGQVGFFSVSRIRYRQSTKDDSSIDKFSLSVGKLKLRIKRPSSSLSTAWITIHIEQVEFRVPNLQALLATSSANGDHDTNRHPQPHLSPPPTTLSRRISRMGNIPHIPWWYSISIVKHIVKFTSALPAQFLMAGLANYVDVQLDGLQVIVEQTNVLTIDAINFSSILFAAMVQQTMPATTTTPLASPGVDTDASSHPHFLNAGHQRHSLKRAQHLFKEKFFEIILQVGPVSIGDQGLVLPQGGRIAISCHLSAGCLTLKDVDTSLHVDALVMQLDKLMGLRTLLAQQHSSPNPSPRRGAGGKSKLQLVEMIHSMALSVSHIQVAKEYQQGRSLGVDMDYINVMTTMVPRISGSKVRGRERDLLYANLFFLSFFLCWCLTIVIWITMQPSDRNGSYRLYDI